MKPIRCETCEGTGDKRKRDASGVSACDCADCLGHGWTWEDGVAPVSCTATNHPLAPWVASHIEKHGATLPCGRGDGRCPGCLSSDDEIAATARRAEPDYPNDVDSMPTASWPIVARVPVSGPPMPVARKPGP